MCACLCCCGKSCRCLCECNVAPSVQHLWFYNDGLCGRSMNRSRKIKDPTNGHLLIYYIIFSIIIIMVTWLHSTPLCITKILSIWFCRFIRAPKSSYWIRMHLPKWYYIRQTWRTVEWIFGIQCGNLIGILQRQRRFFQTFFVDNFSWCIVCELFIDLGVQTVTRLLTTRF